MKKENCQSGTYKRSIMKITNNWEKKKNKGIRKFHAHNYNYIIREEEEKNSFGLEIISKTTNSRSHLCEGKMLKTLIFLGRWALTRLARSMP